MTGPIIENPKGKIFVNKGGKAQLVFDTNFQAKHQRRYSRAQMFVDSEILRLSEPMIPLQTGMLIKSGILGTDVGSGEVKWIAPYARAQYYRAGVPGSETGPLRGPQWFERAKAIHKPAIVAGAKRLAGGGS